MFKLTLNQIKFDLKAEGKGCQSSFWSEKVVKGLDEMLTTRRFDPEETKSWDNLLWDDWYPPGVDIHDWSVVVPLKGLIKDRQMLACGFWYIVLGLI